MKTAAITCALFWAIGFGLLYHATRMPTTPLPHRPAAASWDQENLKRHDTGCPESIYTAVNGELIQCPPYQPKRIDP